MTKLRFSILTILAGWTSFAIVAGPDGSAAAETLMEISIRDFGAKMDGVADDTRAFQKALDAVPHGGVLHLPAGTAILTKGLSLANKTVTIRGAGSAATRLLWTAPGGLHLAESRTWNESKGDKSTWDISGIAFLTSAKKAGTALFVDFKTHDRLNLAISVRDCRFEPAPVTGNRGYWSKSIYVNNGHLGRIVDCMFRGSATPEATTSHHIHLTGNSTSFAIDRCHGSNSTYGVLVEGETEGVVIDKCFFVHNRYGYVLNIEQGGEPMFDVSESHAASGVHALWMNNARSSSIVGNCFILARCSKYPDGPKERSAVKIEGNNTKDIIINSSTVQITDKAFEGAFRGFGVENGRGVIITNNTVANNSNATDDLGVWIGPAVQGAIVRDNIYHLKTDETVSVAPSAKDIRVD